jgi:hypothetical protein
VGLVSLQVLISFPIKIGESLKQRKRGLGAIFFKFPSISKENLLAINFFLLLIGWETAFFAFGAEFSYQNLIFVHQTN